eukprot:527490-Prymnesium_polylepis.1
MRAAAVVIGVSRSPRAPSSYTKRIDDPTTCARGWQPRRPRAADKRRVTGGERQDAEASDRRRATGASGREGARGMPRARARARTSCRINQSDSLSNARISSNLCT